MVRPCLAVVAQVWGCLAKNEKVWIFGALEYKPLKTIAEGGPKGWGPSVDRAFELTIFFSTYWSSVLVANHCHPTCH